MGRHGPDFKEENQMGLRINQNIAAMNSYRNLSVTEGQMNKALEKLSSGFRINRAADDAAGLSISENLRAQTGGLKVAVRNAQDGISVVQTAEGAMTEVHSILQRMRDLSVQASNAGSQDTSARTAADTEFQALSSELDRIGNTTKFGNQKLLDGTFGNTAAAVAGAVTGVTGAGKALGAAAIDFKIGGTFNAVAVAAQNVNVASATYTTAQSYQAAVQTAVDTTMAGAGVTGGYTAGDVKAEVKDDGNGVWKVTVSSNKMTSLAITEGTAAGDAVASGLTLQTGTGTAGAGGTFQVGANNNAAERIAVQISAVSSSALGVSGLSLVSGAAAAIDAVDTAIGTVSTSRANLGALQNRFEHTINNLNVTVENLSASESRIRDTDMAQEMMNFTRAQILQQAGTSMLSQANQAPQSVLSLLR
jgi:flagellin